MWPVQIFINREKDGTLPSDYEVVYRRLLIDLMCMLSKNYSCRSKREDWKTTHCPGYHFEAKIEGGKLPMQRLCIACDSGTQI